MAAPVRRGQTAPAAGLTATSPAGTQVGDLVLVFTFERLGSGSATTLTLDSSMDGSIANHFHNDGSTDGAFGIAWKIATASGAQSYQGFTSSTGSPNAATGLEVIQAGTFSRVFPIVGPTTSTGTGAPNPGDLTGLNSARTYLVFAVGVWHLSSAATFTPGFPANYTNTTHIAGSDDIELAWGTRSVTGVTNEDPAAFTDSVTPNGTVAATFAVTDTVDGTGTPAAQASTVAGSGDVADAAGPHNPGRIGRLGQFGVGARDYAGFDPKVSAITGTGALTAQASAVSGAGASSSNGTGTLAAQAATVVGSGASATTGTGALTAQAATVSGSGDVEATHNPGRIGRLGQFGIGARDYAGFQAKVSSITGTGALAASAASAAGSGTSSSSGTGVLAAQAASVAGSGTSDVTGTGALASAAASASGSGISSSAGTGALVAQGATLSGATGARVGRLGQIGVGVRDYAGFQPKVGSVSGTGTIAAAAATVSGSGTSSSTGTGALQAEAASLSGTDGSVAPALTRPGAWGVGTRPAGDFSGRAESITGTGALAAQAATLSGAGTTLSIGTGSLQVGSVTISAAGVSGSTGTGALQAQAATVNGTGDGIVAGTGALQAGASVVVGAGISASVGIGALATASTVSGTGTSGSTGTGALQASDSIIAAFAPVVGAGVLASQAVVVAGRAVVSSFGGKGRGRIGHPHADPDHSRIGQQTADPDTSRIGTPVARVKRRLGGGSA